MTPSLRLFPSADGPAPGANGPAADDARRPAASVRLADLLDVAAAHAGRAWLDDFAAERVLVSADLADVLFAAKAMLLRPDPPAGRERRAA